MKNYRITALMIVLSAFLLTHCATPQPTSVTPFSNPQEIDSLQYKPKADNLLIVLDASESMAKPMGNSDRLTTGKTIIENINQTLPDMELQAALRTFGHSNAISAENTVLMYGLEPYTESGLRAGLERVSVAGGNSSMGRAIEAATQDLAATDGDIVLVVLSDGQNLDGEPIKASERMKAQFGERLCIYTIQVGGAGREGGEASLLMEALAGIGICGKSFSADDLASESMVTEFVTAAFFTQRKDSDKDGVFDDDDKCPGTPLNVQVDASGCPIDSDADGVADYKDNCPYTSAGAQIDENGCPVDSDGDGVANHLDNCPNTKSGAEVDGSGCPLDTDGDGIANYLDKCPDTPKGTRVDYSGCPYFSEAAAAVAGAGTWTFKEIQFDTNSDVLKSSSFDTLDKVADYLNRNTELKVEIQGHTDNTGSIAYNTVLSEKRAKAVEKYLLDKGVSAKQIGSVGYGPSMPIASNDTPGGRAANRRVVFNQVE
jgi:outer membrane protein OmpA-like peptidoglycan-associated protein